MTKKLTFETKKQGNKLEICSKFHLFFKFYKGVTFKALASTWRDELIGTGSCLVSALRGGGGGKQLEEEIYISISCGV